MRKIIKCLTVLSLLFSTAEASVVGLSIHDTTAVQGKMLLLPVYVDSSLTGQNVTSFQLQLGFSGSILSVDSIIGNGTLSQSLGNLTFNDANPNQVSIAVAGSTPLSGTGVLVVVRFRVVGAGNASVAFSDSADNLLNEGVPAVTLRNGTVNVQSAPSINIYPNTAVLTVGDSLQFNAYSGTAPYHLAVTNGAIASIDSNGWLKALHRGFTQVVAVDNAGTVDTSGIVEIRAFGLSIHDTSMLQGKTFDLPVYTSDLTGLTVTAGTMQITFDHNILTPDSIIQTGSLLAAYPALAFNAKTAGQMNVSFAGTNPLAGKGVLFYVRFVVSSTNNYGMTISVNSVVFNENISGNTRNGNFEVIGLGSLYISPPTASLIVGDTLRFSAYNGTPPYTWATTDTTIASIDAYGLMTARRSGTVRAVAHDSVGASGTTSDISIYDVRVTVPEVYGKMAGIVDVPISVDRFTGSNSVLSVQMSFVYDTTIMHAVGIVTTGTLIDGWSATIGLPGNQFVLAAATAAGFQSTGTLVKLRFRVDSSLSYGQNAYINFQQVLFNEGKPAALGINGGVTAVSPPAIPQLTLPANGAINQPTDLWVYWTTPLNANTFRLQVATDSMFTAIVWDDSTLTSTTDHLTTLANNTLYYWRVNAANPAGSGGWSAVWSFTTIVAPPNPPALMAPLSGAINQPTSIVLLWHPANSMMGKKLMAAARIARRGRHVADGGITYHVQLATDSSFVSGMMLDTSGVVDTSVAASGLNNNTTLYWRVSASNIGGTGAWSGFWDFTTIVAPPAAPILGVPPGGSTNQPTSITLMWISSPGTAANKLRAAARLDFKSRIISGAGITYRVQLGTDSGFVNGIVADTSVVDTFLAVTGLANNTAYYWHVNATNIGGTGAWSGVLNFTTISLAPPAPALLSPPDRSVDQTNLLRLYWNSVPGAATHTLRAIAGQLPGKRHLAAGGITYEAQLAADSEFVSVFFDSTGIVDTSALVSGLANNVTYYWRVNATNAGGTSPWSAVWLFTTVLTGVNNVDLLPAEYKLAQNYPNPFNPSTVIEYQLPVESKVTLKVYDMLGRVVTTLADGVQQAGYKSVEWNGLDATSGVSSRGGYTSGVYFYRLEAVSVAGPAKSFMHIGKMLLIK